MLSAMCLQQRFSGVKFPKKLGSVCWTGLIPANKIQPREPRARGSKSNGVDGKPHGSLSTGGTMASATSTATAMTMTGTTTGGILASATFFGKLLP